MSRIKRLHAKRLAAYRSAVSEHGLNVDDVNLLHVLGNRPGFTLNTTNHLASGRAVIARRLKRLGLLKAGGMGVELTRAGLTVAHAVCRVSAEARKGGGQ